MISRPLATSRLDCPGILNPELLNPKLVNLYIGSPKVGNPIASILKEVFQESQHQLSLTRFPTFWGLRQNLHLRQWKPAAGVWFGNPASMTSGPLQTFEEQGYPVPGCHREHESQCQRVPPRSFSGGRDILIPSSGPYRSKFWYMQGIERSRNSSIPNSHTLNP